MEGWIKLHRKLRDNPHMRKPAYKSIWIELLLEATHEEKDIIWEGERIKLKPGQLTCGRKQLSEWTGVPQGTCYRVLKCFESEQMIEQVTSFRFSLITVKNWDKYQINEQVNEQKMNSKRTASEQQMNTPKECNNDKNDNNNSKELRAKPVFGNEEINKMLKALKGTTGRTDFKESQKLQRQYAHHLVNLYKKIGKGEFKARLDIVLGDSFRAKNCNSLKYMYGEIKSASSTATTDTITSF